MSCLNKKHKTVLKRTKKTKKSDKIIENGDSIKQPLNHFWKPHMNDVSNNLWPFKHNIIKPLEITDLKLNVKNQHDIVNHNTWFNVKCIKSTFDDSNEIHISSQFVTNLWPKMSKNNEDAFLGVEINNENDIKILDQANNISKIKHVKIKLHIRDEKDRKTLLKIFGVTRWTYNKCIEKISKNPDIKWTEKSLSELFVNSDSYYMKKYPWIGDVCHTIRRVAVQEALRNLIRCKRQMKNKTIKSFKLGFRSKKQKSQSFYIRRKWIKNQTNNTIVLKFPGMKRSIKFWTGKHAYHGDFPMDCRFQKTWTGKYYLCIPHEFKVDNQDLKKESLKVCSLDPGVRTFQTIYDPIQQCAYEIAPKDMNRIVRLSICLDKLYSKRDKAINAKKRYSYKRASRRLSYRIQNLVNEVHKQLAKHLATNYDLIIIPKFETSRLIKKINRKISSNSARQLSTWAHSRFRQRLLSKCRETKCKVAIVDESWTSKTCSSCGTIDYRLGRKKIFSCQNCHMIMDRDINGAKNIFLKNFEVLDLDLTLGPIPCYSEMNNCTDNIIVFC